MLAALLANLPVHDVDVWVEGGQAPIERKFRNDQEEHQKLVDEIRGHHLKAKDDDTHVVDVEAASQAVAQAIAEVEPSYPPQTNFGLLGIRVLTQITDFTVDFRDLQAEARAALKKVQQQDDDDIILVLLMDS